MTTKRTRITGTVTLDLTVETIDEATASVRITDDGARRITDTGDLRVTET